jgi:TonB family protein
MRRRFLAALVVILPSVISPAQQNDASTLFKPSRVQPAPITYYYAALDVTSPVLMPSNPLPVFTGKCKKQDDAVEFEVIVDEKGKPRDISYSRGLVSDPDKLALQIVAADRFIPGTHSGEPAAVAMSVRVSLSGCIETVKDGTGHKSELFHLKSQPAQEIEAVTRPPRDLAPTSTVQPSVNSDGSGVNRIGSGVTAPIPLNSVEAHYTKEARKARIQGNCYVSVVIDANGMPQNPKVIRSLDPGLDQNALDAVSKYRFKPAMKDGHPVPVMLTIQVSYKIQ